MNTPPTTEEPKATPPECITQNPYQEKDLEVMEIITAKVSRPVTGSADAPWGRKMYVAIPESLQTKLSIEKPSDYIAVVIDKDTGITQFYILAAMAPDRYFIERAAQGLYAYCGITSKQQAQTIVDQVPLDESLSIAAPFFDQASKGMREFAILKKEAMEGKVAKTVLPVQHDLEKYPAALRKGWEQENTTGLPLVIVPNAIAKLLGSTMVRGTLQPANLGNTVAGGTICKLDIDGQIAEVFLVGALDHIYIDPKIKKSFGENAENIQKLSLGITVGQQILKVGVEESIQDIREGVKKRLPK